MAGPVYRSRKPKASPLWQCLFRHFDAFLGQYEERYRKHYGFLRPIIAEVVNKFLDGGDLEHGFARIRCDHCKIDHLLAFSCKGRWLNQKTPTEPPVQALGERMRPRSSSEDAFGA